MNAVTPLNFNNLFPSNDTTIDFSNITPNATPLEVSADYGNVLGSFLQNTGGITPDATGGTDWLSGLGSLFADKNGSIFGGIGSLIGGLGTIFNGYQANKLGRDSLKFQKDAFKTNLNNQVTAYNTNLEDRLNARGYATGQSLEAIQASIDKNKLPMKK